MLKFQVDWYIFKWISIYILVFPLQELTSGYGSAVFRKITSRRSTRGNTEYIVHRFFRSGKLLFNHFNVHVSFIRSGGWTLIRRVTLTDGSLPSKEQQVGVVDYGEQLKNYSSNDHVFNMRGFIDLRENLGFEQTRFYCYNKIPGKAFHVAAKGNSLGEALFQYFIGNTTTPPTRAIYFQRFQMTTWRFSLNALIGAPFNSLISGG